MIIPWEKYFDRPETADWHKLICQELKVSSLDQYLTSPIDQVGSSPFLRQGVDVQCITSVPASSSSTDYYSIVYVKDELSANQSILHELQFGARGIELHLTTSAINWAILLQNVYLNFIGLHIIVGQSEAGACADAVYLFALESGFKKDELSIAIVSSSIKNTGVERILLNELSWAKINVQVDISPSLVERSANLLISLAEQLSSLKAGLQVQSIHVRIGLSSDFIINISAFKAIRSLAFLMLEAHKLEGIQVYVHSYIPDSLLKEDSNAQLIAHTTYAAANYLGEVDSYSLPCIHQGQFDRRITRNISHLLELESQLGQVADPLGGAYYTDHFAYAMVEQIWSLFLEKMKT